LTAGSTGFVSNVTAGDLVVVGYIDSTANTETLGISDGLTSTYPQAWLGNSTSSPTIGAWTIKGWSSTLTSSGADTITLTTTGGSNGNYCQAMEFRWSAGGISGTPLDQTGVFEGTFGSTPTVTTSGNLTANGELVTACFMGTGLGGYNGPGGSFTLGSGSSTEGFCSYLFLPSGSGSGATQTATAATTSSVTSANGIATFKHP